MISVYRKIMTMQIKNGLCLLWLFVLMLLFAACSHRQKGDESWHKDIDEFVPVTNLSCRVILIR